MTKTTPVTAWSATSDKEQIRMEEDLNLNTVQEQKGSFLNLLNGWAENTSYGGVPYIVRNKGVVMKLFWIALVLAGAVITSYQLWQVFDKFFQYPVNVNVNMTYTNKITFPQVTLCNLNPVRVSKFDEIPPAYWPLFFALFGNDTAVTASERLRIMELFHQVYSTMDQGTRSNIGHQRNDMILDCMFNGQECSVKEFMAWNNPVYGNCFSFNIGIIDHGNGTYTQQPLYETFRTGPSYGLTVEVFLEESEYSADLSEQLGVKLVIGPQTKPTFPEDGGIYLHPGTYSSINIQKINITRKKAPYPSRCIDMSHSKDEAMRIDAYIEQYKGYDLEYDIGTCLKTCYQSYVIAECGCGDPKIPINTRATRVRAANQTKEYGPCITTETVDCQYNVTVKYSENKLDCTQCRVACTDIAYAHGISTAYWPNPQYMARKLSHLASINPKLAAAMANSTTPENNILKFNVHFEELNYEVIYESAAYPAESIYSDIGGVLGLWLGLSFIAVFEFFQLAFDSLSLCIIKLGKKRADRLHPKLVQNKF